MTNAQIQPSRRRFVVLLSVSSVSVAAGCQTPGKDDDPPEEGFEYRAVERPDPGTPTDRLEVVEYFWFGCPHCNALEPALDAWRRRQPDDVVLRKVHVALGPAWAPHQQLFYTLESLGLADTLGPEVFKAIHVQRSPLTERNEMADFVAARGVDRQRFLQAFDSQDVRDRMARADADARAVRLAGVPGLAVAGKWLTSPSMAGSQAAALEVVDFLLQRERAARGLPRSAGARPPRHA